ncbi:hypothetical protein LY76DRAFT_597163 [Colletotrichum caudatum]|nr:hypothetical protein LY76DRAFT_597163 [Colletotrichum caudatum]
MGGTRLESDCYGLSSFLSLAGVFSPSLFNHPFFLSLCLTLFPVGKIATHHSAVSKQR